jgi:hypothetical protein
MMCASVQKKRMAPAISIATIFATSTIWWKRLSREDGFRVGTLSPILIGG